MRSSFFVALAASFMITLLVLGVAGYAVTRLAVPHPRDPFRSGQFEFDLAPGWECEPEGDTHVCMPPGSGPRSAAAIMGMKERGPDDTLEDFEHRLRDPAGTSEINHRVAKVRYVKRRKLGHHEWVEALREGSELPNYDTYYLATVTSHMAILVTMSFHEEHEAEYVRELGEMMSTLNVYER